MIRLIQTFLVAVALGAAGCERAPSSQTAKPDKNREVQVGKASFYGEEFAGEKTASGETLKLDDMTAASRTLPLGTHVRVTNKETGLSAKVRINDPGPYAEGRVIDLTPKAARRIGIDHTEGVAPVIVEPMSAERTEPNANAEKTAGSVTEAGRGL